ncbi:hypothetical protein [Fibrobacter sp. UWB11]|uniref:hypothetical protein n=1 Tax=Fibrobacter sp. UWB11 TaxID=1896202 RepID=UPI000927DE8C|nr:hypothetical protein [Fibrobacter sp. UWB11]SIO38309.1 hypothetical protein SAMN05720758_2546 [Fibrobacter sp. UWB11]
MFKLKQNFLLIFTAFTIAVGIAACDSDKNEPQNTPENKAAFEKAIKKISEGFTKDNSWISIAQSPYILTGTLQVDTNEIKKIKKEKGDYIEINFTVDTILKGDVPSKEIIINKYICRQKDKAPYCNDSNLFLFNSKKSVIFLTLGPSGGYYFPNRLPNSIFPEADKVKIKEEIAKQNEIIANKTFAKICPTVQHSSEVKSLIEDMLIASKAKDAYVKLEKLGFQAVPATICLMDDRRELAVKGISLENKSPQAWEAMRHYGPEVVVDVLEAILNQITGKSFGFIHNGGTEEERTSTVNGWRIFLWHSFND